MNVEKLYRLEAQHEELAARRRARSEIYGERLARWKSLKQDATWKALPDVQAMSLASLLALSDDELRELNVDVVTLKRAAFEKRSAEATLRDPVEERNFAASSTLLPRLRAHVGNCK